MTDLHEIFYRYPKNMPLPLVLDGSLGTQLIKRGMPQGVGTLSYILDNPDMLRDIQRGYSDAGSDAVLSATFDGNRPTLTRHGLEGDIMKLVSKAASISVGSAKFVGGDMSTTGLFIEPVGDTPFEEIVGYYAEEAKAIDEYVDFYFIETMINLAELRAAVIGVKSVSDKPVFVSMTINEHGRTMSGDALLPALLTLADLGIAAFGCNCSLGPDSILKALKPIVPVAAKLGIALIAKPNAGVPHNEDGHDTFDVRPEDYSAFAREALDCGIMILGGCCGSNAECITAISEQVKIGYGFEGADDDIDVGLLCCNNHTAAEFDCDVEPVEITEDISDDFDDCDDDVPLLKISSDSLEYLLDAYFAFDRPFALCGDRDAAEKFARIYCGRAVFAGK